MVKQFTNYAVKMEQMDENTFHIVTSSPERGFIGTIEWCAISKRWYLGLQPEWVIGPRTLQRIARFVERLLPPSCLTI